jgi:hypothetical protein
MMNQNPENLNLKVEDEKMNLTSPKLQNADAVWANWQR